MYTPQEYARIIKSMSKEQHKAMMENVTIAYVWGIATVLVPIGIRAAVRWWRS